MEKLKTSPYGNLKTPPVGEKSYRKVKDIEADCIEAGRGGLLRDGKGVPDIRKKKSLMRQRRTIDNWGRILILKPDRQYLQSMVYKYYDYVVEDYMKKLFAVSLLNDDEFPDF